MNIILDRYLIKLKRFIHDNPREILMGIFAHFKSSHEFREKVFGGKTKRSTSVVINNFNDVVSVPSFRPPHSICPVIVGGDGEGPALQLFVIIF